VAKTLEPTSSTGAAPGERRNRSSRRWLAWVVVPVCAVGPWFVPWPWQGDAGVASSSPSSIISRATSQQPTPKTSASAPALPSSGAIDAVNRAVAGSSGAYDLPVSADVAGVKTTPGGYTSVGRIKIPSVGLDVPYGEGVYAKALEKGPGHWPGTPLPGEVGNSVLSGHRNTHTQPFKELDRLHHGDKIVVSVGKGDPTTFRVDNTTIVPEAKFKDFVLRQPADPQTRQITLFACHPEGNPIYRIVVRATVAE
jgi:LPXTG-site transpeptidase (sortase) family protein